MSASALLRSSVRRSAAALLPIGRGGASSRSAATTVVRTPFPLSGLVGTVPSSSLRPPCRSMSSSQDLADVLTREMEEEASGAGDGMTPDLSDLRTEIEEHWRVADGPTVKLYKKDPIRGGAKVALKFHCQDTIESEGAEYEEGEEEQDDEEEVAAAVRFTATVTKAGRTMVLTCLSDNATATVEGVAVVEGDAEDVVGGIDESLYQGPEFSELAEDLQEAFTAYLQEECGVDGDVAAFVCMYADHKEQSEYVSWMKSVRSMLQ